MKMMISNSENFPMLSTVPLLLAAVIVGSISAINHHHQHRIINHKCFSWNSSYECTKNFDCMWCDQWCVHRENESFRCEPLASELEPLFPHPHIQMIKPDEIIIGHCQSIVIEIHGKYLSFLTKKFSQMKNQQHQQVYNEVYGIVLVDHHHEQKKFQCKIITKTFHHIRCWLDNVNINKMTPVKVELLYYRKVYELNSTEKWTSNRHLTTFIPYIKDNNDNYEIDRIIIGFFGGVLATTVIFFIFKNTAKHYEMVKRKKSILQAFRQLQRHPLYRNFLSVTIHEKLGEGNFSEVFRATVIVEKQTSLQVAIKKLKSHRINCYSISMFIADGIKLSKFHHRRVLTPIAVFWDHWRDNMPAIVLPLMAKGDLCNYLRTLRCLSISELLKFSHQIAEGMEYLSEREFIHGDLAARNCLLDEKFDLVIGDPLYQTSESMDNTGNCGQDLNYRPVRWMALECFPRPKFTQKSDIWSFGVTLWEIFTLGSHPYHHIDNDVDVLRELAKGYRLPKPSGCPEEIYQLMIDCWHKDPEQRPTFRQLRSQLDNCSVDDQQQQSSSNQIQTEMKIFSPYTNLAQDCYVNNI